MPFFCVFLVFNAFFFCKDVRAANSLYLKFRFSEFHSTVENLMSR